MAVFEQRRKRKKLSDYIIDDVKRWIVSEGKQPGDRLPNEKELIEQTGYSKSTVREALKALEVGGLIEMRTGPNGGVYLQQVTHEHASEPLRNFLHFYRLGWHDIYQLRKVLEPELAVSVVGKLTDEQLSKLAENLEFCTHGPKDDEDLLAQRAAEIEFHNILASACPNPVLSFVCRFLNDLLADLVVYRNVTDTHKFGETNVDFHALLLNAYRREDAETVHRVMVEHMKDAEDHMHLNARMSGKGVLLASDQR
ncbi:DNA-binding transcriptional regulator, FadR family [Variovorax sp. HW608]|uniref:FadR/GntR family transcriptional regulator n=1 Tax=Variovorax sp. HW608 TaxID=1034889 RepID=UPI00082015D2|nr:FCD domain-containing protein [Variovorax sp. HW608]SCK10275.1 DNA-binding transcriptional regulator, FadR family [Variovorax sp. HW608]